MIAGAERMSEDPAHELALNEIARASVCGWMIDENQGYERLTSRSVDEACDGGDFVEALCLQTNSSAEARSVGIHI